MNPRPSPQPKRIVHTEALRMQSGKRRGIIQKFKRGRDFHAHIIPGSGVERRGDNTVLKLHHSLRKRNSLRQVAQKPSVQVYKPVTHIFSGIYGIDMGDTLLSLGKADI